MLVSDLRWTERNEDLADFLDIKTERWLWGMAMAFCILKNKYP